MRLFLSVKNCCVIVAGLTCGMARAEDRITLDLKNATVQDALSAVFAETGAKYVLAEGVHGEIPCLNVSGVSFETALKCVLRACELSYRVENGIYIIEPKVKEPPKVQEEPSPSVEEQLAAFRARKQAEKEGPAPFIRSRGYV